MKKLETYQAELEALKVRKVYLGRELRQLVIKGGKLPNGLNGSLNISDSEEDQELFRQMVDEFNELAEKIEAIESDIKEIETAIEQAPDKKTKIKILRDICGYNYKQIAEKLGYSYGYIRNLMVQKRCDKKCDS